MVVGLIGVAVRAAALETSALGGVASSAINPDPQGNWWPPLIFGEAGLPAFCERAVPLREQLEFVLLVRVGGSLRLAITLQVGGAISGGRAAAVAAERREVATSHVM